MTMICKSVPLESSALRRGIYEGSVFQLPPTGASLALVEDALAVLKAELGEGVKLRDAHAQLSETAFFEGIGRVRKQLYLDSYFHEAVSRVVAECGFDATRVAFDPIRIRVVAHQGHENPRASSVYYAHRDTWYAHSQSLITWWIPLHDLTDEETFVFYPEKYRQSVPNDSETFDYDAWVRDGWGLKVGWQDKNAGLTARYPGVVGELDPGLAVGFACERGQNLLFSGSQFHQTRKQALGRTRFSLDFRVVHLGDHSQEIGAPNVDNRSNGSALVDYIHPASLKECFK